MTLQGHLRGHLRGHTMTLRGHLQGRLRGQVQEVGRAAAWAVVLHGPQDSFDSAGVLGLVMCLVRVPFSRDFDTLNSETAIWDCEPQEKSQVALCVQSSAGKERFWEDDDRGRSNRSIAAKWAFAYTVYVKTFTRSAKGGTALD